MITLSCPSCGASVEFKSKASVFAVCSFCKSTLVRQDMNLEKIGEMSDLQDDLTPLQIGTAGMYEGKSFDLVGRMQVSYPDGYWNEWYALFNDSQTGWLAEAQGFYAMCFQTELPEVPDKDGLAPGLLVKFGTVVLEVEDIRDVKCTFSEGELPINAVEGRRSTSVDFAGRNNHMATIEYAKNETRIFQGSYKDFDELKFRNLRYIDGWKL